MKHKLIGPKQGKLGEFCSCGKSFPVMAAAEKHIEQENKSKEAKPVANSNPEQNNKVVHETVEPPVSDVPPETTPANGTPDQYKDAEAKVAESKTAPIEGNDTGEITQGNQRAKVVASTTKVTESDPAPDPFPAPARHTMPIATPPAATPTNPQTDMMIARQAQEVQVAMLAAKRFPRDEIAAMNRIRATCQRPTLADQAIYSYPRGGQNVSGPSIRLAEALAQNWGNIDTGIIELENRNGKSEMMAYAWDLETNSRVTKTFSVEHKRDTRSGTKELTDGRDIYEATANFGARRQRACILSIIPGDVVEMAVNECRSTIANNDKRSPVEIVDSLIKAFRDLGVSKEQLERFLGKSLADALKEELLDLRGAYKAIKDGQSKASDYFGTIVDPDTSDRIAMAGTHEEVSDILQSLPVPERKNAAPLAAARMKELSV